MIGSVSVKKRILKVSGKERKGGIVVYLTEFN
jgi:hypothetical protein